MAINELFSDPNKMAMLMGGLNMMAASRGGNTDLTKGGVGYALQQGLQGGIQGATTGQAFADQQRKQKAIDDMLMKLNLDPSAQQSTGVLQPGMQDNAFSQMTPQQREVAKMAIMSGDWKTVSGMLAPEEAMTPYQRESLRLRQQQLDQAGQEDTAALRDFEYYKKLMKTDPVAAEAFGRERGYVSKEGMELPAHLQKRLSEATDKAITAEASAGRFTTLADEIEKANLSGGLFAGKWTEKMKDITGNQDEITNMRQAYMGIRSSQAVQNLPPGVASDKDIELALKGFPTENASGQQIASFLRGMSKLEDFNAKFNSFKAQYISEKGSERDMLKAWKESNKVDGVPEGVPPEVWAVMTPEERAAWQ